MRMTRVLCTRIGISVGLLLGLLTGMCAAQETQVPLDQEGSLMQIDQALEAELQSFPDYPGFQAARLWQVSDSSFVLEIDYKPAGDIQRARILMTAAEAQSFRATISGAVTGIVLAVGPERSGRTAFLIGTAALSLGYYGWALPYALDIDDSKTFAATYMFTSSAGFFGPLFLTRNRDVTDAAATLSFYGGTRGAVHGVLLDELFRGEYKDFRHAITASMLTSLGEYAAGFILADRMDMTAGTAEAISAGGDFGLGFGLMALGAFDIEDDRAAAATILGSSGLGLYGGHLLSQRQHYTRGDAYVLRGTTNVVAYDALAVAVAIIGVDDNDGDDDDDDDEARAAVISAMAGEVAGIGLGHRLLRDKDFSTGQGVLVDVGGLAGALFGVGLGYIADAQDEGYVYWSAAGATGGFFLTYYLFSGEAQAPERGSSLNLEFCPQAIVAMARHGKSGRVPGDGLPIVKLTCRF